MIWFVGMVEIFIYLIYFKCFLFEIIYSLIINNWMIWGVFEFVFEYI